MTRDTQAENDALAEQLRSAMTICATLFQLDDLHPDEVSGWSAGPKSRVFAGGAEFEIKNAPSDAPRVGIFAITGIGCRGSRFRRYLRTSQMPPTEKERTTRQRGWNRYTEVPPGLYEVRALKPNYFGAQHPIQASWGVILPSGVIPLPEDAALTLAGFLMPEWETAGNEEEEVLRDAKKAKTDTTAQTLITHILQKTQDDAAIRAAWDRRGQVAGKHNLAAGLPELKGSPAQVLWAEQIRAGYAAMSPGAPQLQKLRRASSWIDSFQGYAQYMPACLQDLDG